MSDKHIEKSFLYLVLLSILLHVAAFSLVSMLPPEPRKAPEEPTMVELKELPEPPASQSKPKPLPKPEPKPEPKPAKPIPLPKPMPLPRPIPMLPPQRLLPKGRQEAAPKADNRVERVAPQKSTPNQTLHKEPITPGATVQGRNDSLFRTPERGGTEAPRGEGLLKPHRGEQTDLAKLFPSAKRMAKLEETYRKKYQDAEQGDTRLMDTDDPVIGLFSMRFRNALRDRLNAITPWDMGLNRGVTILTITIRRDGSIESVKLIESTGNSQLDELATRASRTTGYVGPLPKKWPHEVLNLIYVFRVGEGGRVTNRWE